MFRRLFWLSAIAGVGYVLWRWARQQGGAAPGPDTTGRLYAPPAPAQPAPAQTTPLGAAPEAPAASSAGPRRIPTRIHRGAPPAAPAPEAPAQPPAPEESPDQPGHPAPGDLAGLVGPQAEAPGDLAGLVGPQAEAPGDLAELIGDAVAGEGGAVDLTPLVSPEAAAGAPTLGPLTNINTADEEALVALPGIGPALARRIIAYRDEHGPFASVEALEAIQGIGPRNIEEFRHLVTV